MWIKAHDSLTKGYWSGVPRAYRFVLIELSLLCRPGKGKCLLPPGKDPISRTVAMLGGDKREARKAVTFLTQNGTDEDPPSVTYLSSSGAQVGANSSSSGALRVVIPNWSLHNAVGKSALRMRDYRAKAKQSRGDSKNSDASQASQSDASRDATEKRREEKRRSLRGGEELEQLSLTPRNPAPPKKARKSSPNAEAWEIWRPLWTKRWSGSYPAGPADGAAMGRLWASATDSANDLQNGVTPGDVFRHWAESYLRDEGREGYLLRERHPLRTAHHSLARYGLPGEERALDNNRPELERL